MSGYANLCSQTMAELDSLAAKLPDCIARPILDAKTETLRLLPLAEDRDAAIALETALVQYVTSHLAAWNQGLDAAYRELARQREGMGEPADLFIAEIVGQKETHH